MAPSLAAVSWDSRDPAVLAAFWAEALGWQVSLRAQDRVGLASTDGTGFGFVFIRGVTDRVGANRMHLDLSSRSVDDQRETVGRLIRLGVSEVGVGQGDDSPHVVLADPERQRFLCVGAGQPLRHL